jgi:hypothetical protein
MGRILAAIYPFHLNVYRIAALPQLRSISQSPDSVNHVFPSLPFTEFQ